MRFNTAAKNTMQAMNKCIKAHAPDEPSTWASGLLKGDMIASKTSIHNHNALTLGLSAPVVPHVPALKFSCVKYWPSRIPTTKREKLYS